MEYPVLPLSFLPRYEQYGHLEHSTQAVIPQMVLERDIRHLGRDTPLPNPTVYRLTTPFETVTHVTPHFMEGIDHIYVGRQVFETLLLTEPYPKLSISLVYPSPPQATLIALQPETTDFAMIPNLDPRQVLEQAFRNHYCVLTLDQPLSLRYQDQSYYFYVKTLEPTPVVLVTDTEPSIEFLPALHQPSPPRPPPLQNLSQLSQDSQPSNLPPIVMPNIPLQPDLPSAFETDNGNNNGEDESDSDSDNIPMSMSTHSNKPQHKPFQPFSGEGNRLGN